MERHFVLLFNAILLHFIYSHILATESFLNFSTAPVRDFSGFLAVVVVAVRKLEVVSFCFGGKLYEQFL